MHIHDIGLPIAVREFDAGDKKKITLILGKPQTFPDGQDHFCPYQITGTDHDDVIWYAGGVDAVQAIMLALKQADATLRATAEYKAGKLTWVASDEVGDLGLPQIAPYPSA